ncbi:MAG: cupin domain-containing protein [Alphaproteobacteria bacterium]
MATELGVTLAEAALPPDVLAEMERLNQQAAPLNIWLRTRANAPQKHPWHVHADEAAPDMPPGAGTLRPPPAIHKPVPYLWRWAEIEPYLHRIAEIAPLEFTERQQFLLLNPGLGGARRVTNTMRVAVSIYKPGDQAVTHVHTPNASRTILSAEGGYSTIEGEKCTARRGDLILTPNGTWHGHGNESAEPVIWMDVLDWPLLETLDCIWIEEQDPAQAANRLSPGDDYSRRHYGQGGMVPRLVSHRRGTGRGNSPMLHYHGADIRGMLDGLAGEDGSPHEGVMVDFTNPVDGGPVFTTLGHAAQMLRPGESTLPWRHTASTLYCVIEGEGVTEVGGERLDWRRNDIFVVPNHMWRRHENKSRDQAAVLYSVTDAPLLQKIGQYRAQGRTRAGDVVELDG